jgi:hypothetical protein
LNEDDKQRLDAIFQSEEISRLFFKDLHESNENEITRLEEKWNELNEEGKNSHP